MKNDQDSFLELLNDAFTDINVLPKYITISKRYLYLSKDMMRIERHRDSLLIQMCHDYKVSRTRITDIVYNVLSRIRVRAIEQLLAKKWHEPCIKLVLFLQEMLPLAWTGETAKDVFKLRISSHRRIANACVRLVETTHDYERALNKQFINEKRLLLIRQ